MLNFFRCDALIAGYEPLGEGLDFPDPDDQHFLAAAIRCEADIIVTFNLKDFPAGKGDGFILIGKCCGLKRGQIYLLVSAAFGK